MSQLTVVREALATNSQIKVVDVKEEVYFPHPSGYWSQTFAFVVAPVEPIFSIDQLNHLMMSLVPLKPTMCDRFYGLGNSISFGKLYFDEEVGYYIHDDSKEYVLTDPDFNPEGNFEDRKMKVEVHERVSLRRRIWVYLFPTLGYARSLKHKENGWFSARKSDLRRELVQPPG